MLKKSHITNIEIYSPEWHQHRIGRLTSSLIFNIMGEEGIGKGGMTYLTNKAGEIITGKSNEREFAFDEDLEHGKLYEPEATEAFGKALGVKFLVTQKLIAEPEGRCSSTPDAIIVHGECLIDASEYSVSSAEGKCPRTYHGFIPLFLCETPADLYKISKKYYWQTIDQMHQCGAAVGYFFVYHPEFPPGSNLNVIVFKKMDLWEHFKLLSQRKKQAIQILDDLVEKMRRKKPQNNWLIPTPAKSES